MEEDKNEKTTSVVEQSSIDSAEVEHSGVEESKNTPDVLELNTDSKKEDKPSNKGTIILIVLLILLVLGLGGYICYDKFIAKKPETNNTETKTKEKNGEKNPEEEKTDEESSKVDEKLLTGKTLGDFALYKNNEEEYPCYGEGTEGSFITFSLSCDGLMDLYLFTNDKKCIVEGLGEQFISIIGNEAYLYKDKELLKINANAEIQEKHNIENVQQVFKEFALLVENGVVKLYFYDTMKTLNLGKLDQGYEYEVYPSGYYDKNNVYGEHKPGYYFAFVNRELPDESFDMDDTGQPLNAIEYYYIPETGETGKIKTFVGGYAKPVLYLYPEKDNTKVQVSFEKPGLLTTTYPKFNKVWNVTANKNGDLHDRNGKYYYGLYWEESGSSKVDFTKGFYVTKDNAISFLEEKLTKIGLNDRERNEFIMYWLPILEKNGKNLVYFELTEEREAYNKLKITPKPDSLLRLAIHVKKVDKKVNIKEQDLPTFKRSGFTAIEWGGVVH